MLAELVVPPPLHEMLEKSQGEVMCMPKLNHCGTWRANMACSFVAHEARQGRW
jgi:hypothetical protein